MPDYTGHPFACKSGRHLWSDPGNKCRCCNGFIRVHDSSRAALEKMGAEHITWHGTVWRGWRKESSK